MILPEFRQEITRNVDIEEMNFIHFSNEISFRVDDEGSIKILFITFSWNGTDGVHRVFGALEFDGFEGGRIGKILGVVYHVLFSVW